MKKKTLKTIIKAFEQEVEMLKGYEQLNIMLIKQINDLKQENEILRADLKELSETTFKK